MFRRGHLAFAVLAWGGSGGCTNVNEQPALPPQIVPAPVKAVVKRTVRPLPRVWQSQSGFATDRAASVVPAVAPRDAGPVAAADTLNGDPNGLKAEVLQQVLDAAMPRMGTCFETTEGSVNVALSFEVDPSGRAGKLKVSGVPAAERCLAGVVSGLKLPSFAGPPVPIRYPLTIHRAPSSKPASALNAPPEPPRPVFVNP